MILKRDLIQSEEILNITFIIICTLVVTLALIIEYGYEIEPCALCLTQRLLMFIGGSIAVVGLAHDPRLGIYPVLSLLAILFGIIVAIRHIYIQINPDASGTCGMELQFLVQNDYPLTDILNAMISGTGSCAEPSIIPVFALVSFLILGTIAIKQVLQILQATD